MLDATETGARGPFTVAANGTTILLREPAIAPADSLADEGRLRHGLAVMAAPCILFWTALAALLALLV